MRVSSMFGRILQFYLRGRLCEVAETLSENKKTRAISAQVFSLRSGKLCPALVFAQVGDHGHFHELAIVGLDTQIDHVEPDQDANAKA
jgi:hypothetical protein